MPTLKVDLDVIAITQVLQELKQAVLSADPDQRKVLKNSMRLLGISEIYERRRNSSNAIITEFK